MHGSDSDHTDNTEEDDTNHSPNFHQNRNVPNISVVAI